MIIPAGIPEVLIKKFLADRVVRSWIYLGQDASRAMKFKSFLPPEARQIDYSRLLYRVSEERRCGFVAWIDAISFSGKPSPEWLFSVPAVKNPYSSNLYLHACYFFVLQDILKQETPDVIVTESPALGEMLSKAFPLMNMCPGYSLFKPVFNASVFIKSVLRLFMHGWNHFFRLLAAKIVLKKRARKLLKGASNVVFLRSYITGAYTDSDQDIIEKRYYPGLYGYLEKNGKTPVFLPMGINVDNYFDLFKRVKDSQRRIVFVEEFLGWGDYFRFLTVPLKALFYRFHIPAYEGSDLSKLVKEEYFDNLTEHGFLLGVWCYKFGKRFKEAGLTCESIINWAENQAFEKGLISGLKEAFGSSMKIIAAHPFCIPPNHISLIPSRQEEIFHLMPDKALVLGPIGKAIIAQYMNKNTKPDIVYAPLFRYESVYESFNINLASRDVLAFLGIGFSSALFTLDMLLRVADRLDFYENILIKLHPMSGFTGEDLLARLGRKMPQRCQFIKGNFEDNIKSAAVGICGATGTAVELVVRGIPVVVIAENQALTMNYLAYRQDDDLWKVCFSSEEVVLALNSFRTLREERTDVLKQKAIAYRDAYFSSPDQQQFANFL